MKLKQFEVRGCSYQVRKLQADVASYIYFRMMGALLELKRTAPEAESDRPEQENKLNDAEKARLLCGMAVMKLSFEDLQFVNRHAIQAVDKVVPGQPGVYIPVMNDAGRWTDDGVITDDPSLLNELVMASLEFSLAGFFSGSGDTKATDPATTNQ